MEIKGVQKVSNDLNDRMGQYTHSMQPTNDEVSLALLLCHINDLEKLVEKARNCLVCACIADPSEVCNNTLAVLDTIEVIQPHTGIVQSEQVEDIAVEYIDTTNPADCGGNPTQGKENDVCSGMHGCLNQSYTKGHTMCEECSKNADTALSSTDTTSLHVHYWPCGTWCLAEDLHEYNHMSDDYTIIELPDTTTPEDIDDIVLIHDFIKGD